MGARVAVAGASGYAGGELLRLLRRPPRSGDGPAGRARQRGTSVTAVHPQLTGHPGLPGDAAFISADPARLADADLLFAALPARGVRAAGRRPPGSAQDHRPGRRLPAGRPPGLARYTQRHTPATGPTGCPSCPGPGRVGMNLRVATPGCYATTAILALAPLLAAGLVEPSDIVIVAASGTSGAGRSLRPDLLATEVMGSMSAYRAGGLRGTSRNRTNPFYKTASVRVPPVTLY